MKQKQRIVLFGMVAVVLIFTACDGDSGNNGTEPDGNSSSSAEIYSSSEQVNLSSVVNSSSSSIWESSSSVVVSSSSAKVESSSSVTLSSSAAKSSSSSVGVSSSSVVASSSSAKAQSSSSSIEYGALIYGGQTYKTVVIGTQTWMAENLNYADSAAMPNLNGNSWCYDNSADSCAKYGRLYTWTGAMNIDSSYLSASPTAVIPTPHQGACPAGWHVPTDDDWMTLENWAGGSRVAGTKLKSTSGWSNNGNGTDAYGFSALPAGRRHYSGDLGNVDSAAYFWSASEDDSDYANDRELYNKYGFMITFINNKRIAISVRCVKD